MSPKPLLVGVADLLRRPGTRKEVRRDVPLDQLAVAASAVPAGASIGVDLVLESISDAIVATGTIEAPWRGACRRCLEEVRGTVRPAVREVFQAHHVEGETYPLKGDHVDLEPMVREAVLLALPLAPLCRQECRGPDPERFPAAVEDAGGAQPDGDDEAPARDPRWAGLDQLRFDE